MKLTIFLLSLIFISNAYGDINVSGGIKYSSPSGSTYEKVDEPSEPSEGDLWRNPKTNELKKYDGAKWIFKSASELALKQTEAQVLSNDDTIEVDNSYIKVVGDGAVILDTDPAIENADEAGKWIFIEGTSDTNTVTITNGVNTRLIGEVSVKLGNKDTIGFIFSGTEWVEFIERSDK